MARSRRAPRQIDATRRASGGATGVSIETTSDFADKPVTSAENRARMTDQDKIEKHVGLIFQHVARLRSRLYDQQLAPHGLTSAQVFALNYLMREDGLTQVELARYLGIGTVAVSGLIDRLEAAQWVVRKPDSRDRRSNRIWLLPAAEQKKQVLREAADIVNAASMAGLSPAEIDQLLAMMRKIRKNLAEALKDDPDIGLPPAHKP